MKQWFSLALLIGALLYTGYGVVTLRLMNAPGRPGPGFFPAIIGVLLIATTGLAFYRDLRERLGKRAANTHPDEVSNENVSDSGGVSSALDDDSWLCPRDVAIMVALLVGFILSLKILGGLIAMITFMVLYLSIFNRRKHLQNMIYSVALPLFLFWLFGIMLNASLPQGIFDF